MYPYGPSNVFVIPTYAERGFVVRWDSPFATPANTKFNIVGVNIYRSLGSPDAGFVKINTTPVEGLSYTDKPQPVTVTESPIEIKIPDSNDCFFPVLRTSKKPIVDTNIFQVPTNDPRDVTVTVDGENYKVFSVEGFTGKIELDNRFLWNPETKSVNTLPDLTETSDVQITYTYLSQTIQRMPRQPIWYRVTSVLQDGTETPLERVTARTYLNADSLTWYWKEAVTRNSWLLFQGGERVKLYIRKWSGVPCDRHVEESTEAMLESHKYECPRCFGTRFIGGFYGPHDILIAPQSEEHPMDRSERGYTDLHTQSSWTGPSPILTQRDLIIKQTGERYLIGPVSAITCPGGILQQEFTLQPIHLKDFLYTFPLDGTDEEVRKVLEWPAITNHEGALADQERGRTEVFVESTHGSEGNTPQEWFRRAEWSNKNRE